MKSRYIGKWFITFDASNRRQYAGKCIRRLTRNTVEVRLIEWFMGTWDDVQVWPDTHLEGATVLDTEKDWISLNTYLTEMYNKLPECFPAYHYGYCSSD